VMEQPMYSVSSICDVARAFEAGESRSQQHHQNCDDAHDNEHFEEGKRPLSLDYCAEGMRFSFYNRDAAGEHDKVIQEGQHKESIMFLAERPASHWVSFSIFYVQNAQRVSHHGQRRRALALPATQLSGPEGQHFLLLDD